MSRHGYSDGWDHGCWSTIRWRGMVASAIRGARGQVMLRDLAVALDAMEKKELTTGAVVQPDGCCCALGALLQQREVPYLDKLVEAHDDQDVLADWNADIADDLDVAEPLVLEIAYTNDEHWLPETPAERWVRMRQWVAARVAS